MSVIEWKCEYLLSRYIYSAYLYLARQCSSLVWAPLQAVGLAAPLNSFQETETPAPPSPPVAWRCGWLWDRPPAPRSCPLPAPASRTWEVQLDWTLHPIHSSSMNCTASLWLTEAQVVWCCFSAGSCSNEGSMCGWRDDSRQSCPLFVSGLSKRAARQKQEKQKNWQALPQHLMNVVHLYYYRTTYYV